MSQASINLWYSLFAPFYDSAISFEEPFNGRKKLIEKIGLDEGESLIELCCGTGKNIPYLPEGIQGHFLDINEMMLGRARFRNWIRRKDFSFYKQNALETNFSDSYFDKGLLTYALSGTPNNNLLLKEMSRIIKEEGIVGVLDFYSINCSFLGGVAGLNNLGNLIRDSSFEIVEEIPSEIILGDFSRTKNYMYVLKNKKH